MTTTDPTDTPGLAVLDDIRATRDSLSVRRVFGDAYTIDDVTIIPVARVAGSGGGGGGEGIGPNDEGGHGFGTGFGLSARPVGIYEIRDGHLTWKPVIDTDRLARGGQLLAGVIVACLTIAVTRRQRR